MIAIVFRNHFKQTYVCFAIFAIVSSFFKANASNIKCQLSSGEIFSEESEYNYDFDLETAILKGISPDLRRTTNKASSSGVKSAPGCPEPYEGKAWVYYGDPPKCHLPGYRPPCLENMVLLPQDSSDFGYCNCACSEYILDTPGDSHLLNSPKLFCSGKTPAGKNRFLAFRKEWGTCHYIFDQGKCTDGDWLVFSDNPTLGPYCEKRRCPVEETGTGIYSFFDYRTNLCHKIGDKCEGPCDKLYGFSSTYYTSTKSWSPACGTESNTRFATYGIQESNCKETEKFSSLLKKCFPRPLTRSIGDIG